MGKQIKLREAQLRAASEAISAQLRERARTVSGPRFIETYDQLPAPYRARIEAYRAFALRAPEDWRCRLRVRSPEARFRDLVKFTFAAYPVPRHLENAWLDDLQAQPRQPAMAGDAVPAARINADARHWYIVVGRGRSLHREGACLHLSRVELHHFLTAPDEVDSTQHALWYAVARPAVDDGKAAFRVARSKLANFPVTWPFWKEAARFFARNRLPILEVNDLIDYLQAQLEQDPDFSLHGRSVPALRRRMHEWHRALRELGICTGGHWRGLALPNAEYRVGEGPDAAIWRFKQIRSGEALYREGVRMHHCVVSYKYACVGGDCSIWSVTREAPPGQVNRALTLEVRNDGTIIQARGVANRAPFADEAAIVKTWAADYGLTCDPYELP